MDQINVNDHTPAQLQLILDDLVKLVNRQTWTMPNHLVLLLEAQRTNTVALLPFSVEMVKEIAWEVTDEDGDRLNSEASGIFEEYGGETHENRDYVYQQVIKDVYEQVHDANLPQTSFEYDRIRDYALERLQDWYDHEINMEVDYKVQIPITTTLEFVVKARKRSGDDTAIEKAKRDFENMSNYRLIEELRNQAQTLEIDEDADIEVEVDS